MKTEGEEIEYPDDEIEENTVKQEPTSNSVNDIDNEDILTMKGYVYATCKTKSRITRSINYTK